jgi:hypothetical protein
MVFDFGSSVMIPSLLDPSEGFFTSFLHLKGLELAFHVLWAFFFLVTRVVFVTDRTGVSRTGIRVVSRGLFITVSTDGKVAIHRPVSNSRETIVFAFITERSSVGRGSHCLRGSRGSVAEARLVMKWISLLRVSWAASCRSWGSSSIVVG